MKEKKTVQNTREEFSIEFGDVNGTKLYEVLQAKNSDKKRSKKENKPAETAGYFLNLKWKNNRSFVCWIEISQ